MSVLDDIISTGKNVVTTAGKKTDEAVRFSKLKIRESQVNSDIKAKFEKLGSLVYSMEKSGEKDPEAYRALITELDSCYAELSEIDDKMNELKNEVVCPKCGAKTKNENLYCPKCGEKLPVKKTEETVAEAKAEDKKED